MEDIVEMLLGKGADCSSKNNEDDTPLHIAASESQKVSEYNFFAKSDTIHVNNKEFFLDKAKIAEILIYYGAKMELRNKAGYTPLLRAFDWSGNFTIILK